MYHDKLILTLLSLDTIPVICFRFSFSLKMTPENSPHRAPLDIRIPKASSGPCILIAQTKSGAKPEKSRKGFHCHNVINEVAGGRCEKLLVPLLHFFFWVVTSMADAKPNRVDHHPTLFIVIVRICDICLARPHLQKLLRGI